MEEIRGFAFRAEPGQRRFSAPWPRRRFCYSSLTIQPAAV